MLLSSWFFDEIYGVIAMSNLNSILVASRDENDGLVLQVKFLICILHPYHQKKKFFNVKKKTDADDIYPKAQHFGQLASNVLWKSAYLYVYLKHAINEISDLRIINSIPEIGMMYQGFHPALMMIDLNNLKSASIGLKFSSSTLAGWCERLC